MTQLTDGPGNDAQPCYDPAGTRIAFTSDRAGNWDIWVVDISGRNPIQITSSPMPELNPTWSPDGRKIAYCRLDPREDRGSLWIVDLENPGVKRLIGEGMFPAWSPAGDKIAYQRAKARSSRWYSIWTIDFVNDEVLFPTEVASSHNGALVTPVWSGDGGRLAFCMITAQSGEPEVRNAGLARTSAAVADIGVVDVDGRGLQCLTDGAGECYAPSWSKDGRVFFSQRAEGRETIWSMRPFSPDGLMASPPGRTAGVRRAADAGEDLPAE
jgi:Tol biopolymer transport system component